MPQGVPVPEYIFRGHAAPVHALTFSSGNLFLISGDSDGWIVAWFLATKRPIAVWRGHLGGVMALREWKPDRLISHGRDHKLRVWSMKREGLEGMEIRLPVEMGVGTGGIGGGGGGNDIVDRKGNGKAGEKLILVTEHKQPWLLHALSINALNYCAFSTCVYNDDTGGEAPDNLPFRPVPSETTPSNINNSLLLAASNGLDAGGIDIFHLPSEHRISKIPSDKSIQTGMVMAVSLLRHGTTQKLMLASGYESGHILLHSTDRESTQLARTWMWTRIMMTQPHSQPVLSIDSTLSGAYVFSSSADAVVARFNIEQGKLDKRVETKHAGQQDLQVRNDHKIFATAGWDKRVRVYSVKTMKEVAVLKWHQEGCSAIAFADTGEQPHPIPVVSDQDRSVLATNVEFLKNQQVAKSTGVHWLAAGGKDGKISLWNIY